MMHEAQGLLARVAVDFANLDHVLACKLKKRHSG